MPRKSDNHQGELLSLEVRDRPELEDPILVGSLKLTGSIPVRENLHVGEEITVTIANADGTVISSGIYEVGHPAFKDVTMPQVGPIGTERVHTAAYQNER